MKKLFTNLFLLLLTVNGWAQTPPKMILTVDKIGKGIAAQYPGDQGIEKHPSVIFTERFEAESFTEVMKNWSWNLGGDDHRLSLDQLIGPDGNTENKSLKMTILRENGDARGGSTLRKVLDKGYEQLFFRFYVKFAEDYGFNHHFTGIGGELNPNLWVAGNAGYKPDDRFGSAMDLNTRNINNTGPDHTPPGYWFFYCYWPEMRSYQNIDGTSDGSPKAYFGNNFMPNKPVAAKRGEWQCVEIMVRFNSSPDKADGAQAFWIDGELVGHWDPEEEKPVEGYWIRDYFRHNPEHKDAKPFSGFKWRTFEDAERFEKFKINTIKLQNYVSGASWDMAEKYVKEHPDFKINLQEATVWKDNIVVATEYIGPIEKKINH